MKIAIDMHGGDDGLAVSIPAVKQALNSSKIAPNTQFLLFGDEVILQNHLKQFSQSEISRLLLCHAPEVVTMSDELLTALRRKPNSSMRQAIMAVKDGYADVAVSAGNTGALMALGQMLIKTCDGISRSALISAIPTVNHHCYMLDLGANIECSAKQLLEFAMMGHCASKVLDNKENPKIALLNVGHEEIKGNSVIKEAHQLLRQQNLNYTGFVEGNDIFFDKADIIVCDGLLGNVALKTAEGVAHLVADKLKSTLSQSLLSKMASLPALPYLRQMKNQLNPHTLNGAPLLGLKQNIIKSHGGTSVEGFAHAIEIATVCVDKRLPERISEGVDEMLTFMI